MPGGGSHWADRKPVSPPQTMIYSRNGRTLDSLPDDFYSTRYYTDIMLEFLEGNRGDGQPFFAFLSYTAPHDPLHAPQEYIDKYRGAYDSGWDVLRRQRLQALKDLGIIQADAEPFPRLASVKAWSDMSADERQNYRWPQFWRNMSATSASRSAKREVSANHRPRRVTPTASYCASSFVRTWRTCMSRWIATVSNWNKTRSTTNNSTIIGTSGQLSTR